MTLKIANNEEDINTNHVFIYIHRRNVSLVYYNHNFAKQEQQVFL